ncbi:MAG: hypothetical protein IJB09_04895 [Oscillospiraceae bacterium]|nr:hypothetical protein [Oscillospiraceae bacterium]
MIENVIKFFELYNKDEALRKRVLDAEAMYPGSLEIREAVVEDVLLPIAKDIGLEFDISDLRKYETRLKMSKVTMDDEEWIAMDDDGGAAYWLLDRGWESNIG